MTTTATTGQANPTSRAWAPLDARHTDRYGVFFRPDARTCRTQIELHQILKHQFGLVSAGAFPPHATLLGNIGIHAAEQDLLDRVAQAVAHFPPITVHNGGLNRDGGGVAFGIHLLPDGTVNNALVDLATRIDDAVAPIRRRTDEDYLTGHTTAATHFRAHLTVAGHDLALRPDLADEVWAYINELDIRVPTQFTVDAITVFRFRSDHWTSQWWTDMTWQHLTSWKLHDR